MDNKQLGLFEPEKIKTEPDRKLYISPNQSESNISAFLQTDRHSNNVMLNGCLIRDYVTQHDMKLLKLQLFIWDDKEKKWFYKTPHNWKHYVLMMKQFKRYSGEQV